MTRSTRPEVRNPVLALPAAARLASLDPASREALRAVLVDLGKDAHTRAEAAWQARKAPMAAYWRAVGVYAGHIARAIKAPPAARIHQDGLQRLRSDMEAARSREAACDSWSDVANAVRRVMSDDDSVRCMHGMFFTGAGACPACSR